MLEKLLQEIQSGGTFETGTLAARLGTTPELVKAMLEHLQRSGYIQPHETCNDGCAQCSLNNECLTSKGGERVRLWRVNVKRETEMNHDRK